MGHKRSVLKRLYWDLLDKTERQYYYYAFIRNVPGLFGDYLRARFLSSRVLTMGENALIQAGTRFRSMENLTLGDNVTIGFDNFIQSLGGIKIGNNSMTGPGVKIWSVNHNFSDKDVLVKDQGQTKSEVVIGNDVWIAANAFILPGVNLPDGVIVSTGAVVGVKEYKPNAIIAGNPARVIGYRE